ncbi:MAG: hypothetical protein DRO36_02525 [Candidatus Hecatellales archaeon]|nr:MAG: hypothetical protein DRO36_02525 [Candidatus Hecatellales archaeon]
MKRLLEELASKKGRHTELITLYIPAGRQLSEVLNTLRQNMGQPQTLSQEQQDTMFKMLLKRLFKS